MTNSAITTNTFAHYRMRNEQVTPSNRPLVGDAGLGTEFHRMVYYNNGTGESIQLTFCKHSNGAWCVGFHISLNRYKQISPCSTANGFYKTRNTAQLWAIGEIHMILVHQEQIKEHFRAAIYKDALIQEVSNIRQLQIDLHE